MDNDSNKVSFATLKITDDVSQGIQDFMDKNGQYIICLDQSVLNNSNLVTINIETISFETQKTMLLEVGKNYYFKSNIRLNRPSSSYKVGDVLKIKYRNLDESTIELQYLGNKVELSKRKNSGCGLHYLLNNY